MTLRHALDQRKRVFVLSLWIGFPVWIFGLILVDPSRTAHAVIALGGFALFFLWIILAWTRMKCSMCRENLYLLLMENPWSLKSSAKLKCCPYCATRLDSEI